MKRLFFTGVIVYSTALLFLQDWPSMVGATGIQSAPFLALMVIDAAFVVTALIKAIGFSGLGIDEDDDDEVSIHASDVQVPDTWFYGIFALDLVGHIGWHGYESVTYSGAYSFYSSIWFMVEILALVLTWIFFRHAMQVAQREARKARANKTPRAVA